MHVTLAASWDTTDKLPDRLILTAIPTIPLYSTALLCVADQGRVLEYRIDHLDLWIWIFVSGSFDLDLYIWIFVDCRYVMLSLTRASHSFITSVAFTAPLVLCRVLQQVIQPKFLFFCFQRCDCSGSAIEEATALFL